MALPDNTSIYGKITPPVPKNFVTLKLDKEIGFRYPIQNPPKRGYFCKVSGMELYRTNLRHLIRTSKGERFMLPDYGCNLTDYLMDPLDNSTFNEIKNDIYTSINKYLQQISISKLQVFDDQINKLTVKLFCEVKNESFSKFDLEITV